MLQHLHIQNYALIEELDIDFEQGFSVITGETGAGKSILLGALGLLLGQRADSRSIKEGASRCIIEAQFDVAAYSLQQFFEENDLDYEDICIIRREITAAGKSRAFVNDTPTNLNQLKELGEQLIDIHSQHQNLLLSKEDFQLQVLDVLAKNKENVDVYSNIYRRYKELIKELEETKAKSQKDQAQLDYISFQVRQLQDTKLEVGEDEKLEKELETLEHAEEIKGSLFQASALFDGDEGGLIQMIYEANRQLSSITRYYNPAEELSNRVESCYLEMKDIANEISRAVDDVDYDPDRLQWINDRLNTIYELEQKHHTSNVKELIEIQKHLEKDLENIENSDEHIQELEAQLKELHGRLATEAAKLTHIRAKAAEKAEKEMTTRLAPLGMPNVQFKIEIASTKDFEPSGTDKVNFLFNANKNGALQPISNIASGGEIARVMLCLKALLCSAVKLPTIIFDEIDTGVSGQIAEKMALIMQGMGTDNHLQVISITHLPQIAAMGENHYKVYKEEGETATTSHITRLNQEERITEIAHMLSGTEITEAAMTNARALLHI